MRSYWTTNEALPVIYDRKYLLPPQSKYCVAKLSCSCVFSPRGQPRREIYKRPNESITETLETFALIILSLALSIPFHQRTKRVEPPKTPPFLLPISQRVFPNAAQCPCPQVLSSRPTQPKRRKHKTICLFSRVMYVF